MINLLIKAYTQENEITQVVLKLWIGTVAYITLTPLECTISDLLNEWQAVERITTVCKLKWFKVSPHFIV